MQCDAYPSIENVCNLSEQGLFSLLFVSTRTPALVLLRFYLCTLCVMLRWGSFILHYMELVTLRCAIYIAQDHVYSALCVCTHCRCTCTSYPYYASKFSNLMPARWYPYGICTLFRTHTATPYHPLSVVIAHTLHTLPFHYVCAL